MPVSYSRNSLKATLCVRGRDLLYEYCSKHGIPHKQIGKLIVAIRSSEIPKLDNIRKHGTENGVGGLKMIEASEAMRMDPELRCVEAVLSPLSGIVDSHSLMLSLVVDAENNKATFSYNSTVIGGHLEGNQIHLYVSETKYLEELKGNSFICPELILIPRLVVNSAGLSASAFAKRFSVLSRATVPSTYFSRDCYFALSNIKVPSFRRLIYRIPEDGGLGVHVTLDLNNQVKFAPEVEWIAGIDDTSSFLNK